MTWSYPPSPPSVDQLRPAHLAVERAPAGPARLDQVLQRLHQHYQGQMVASLSWGGNSAASASSDAGREFLEQIVEYFWDRVQEETP